MPFHKETLFGALFLSVMLTIMMFNSSGNPLAIVPIGLVIVGASYALMLLEVVLTKQDRIEEKKR